MSYGLTCNTYVVMVQRSYHGLWIDEPYVIGQTRPIGERIVEEIKGWQHPPREVWIEEVVMVLED